MVLSLASSPVCARKLITIMSKMIIGTRYQCGNCPSIPHPYNLVCGFMPSSKAVLPNRETQCKPCDDKSYMVHDPTHIFFKLRRPVDRRIESSEPILPALYVHLIPPKVLFMCWGLTLGSDTNATLPPPVPRMTMIPKVRVLPAFCTDSELALSIPTKRHTRGRPL